MFLDDTLNLLSFHSFLLLFPKSVSVFCGCFKQNTFNNRTLMNMTGTFSHGHRQFSGKFIQIRKFKCILYQERQISMFVLTLG